MLGTGFELAGDIRDATLEVTAHGLVEVFVNGHRVGDDELVPGFTAYRKRLQVFSYRRHRHAAPRRRTASRCCCSDGWFRGRHGFERRADGFGTETALLLRLDVVDADGTPTRVVTDADWRSRPSHITRADLMDGQSVDFRLLDGSRPGRLGAGRRGIRRALRRPVAPRRRRSRRPCAASRRWHRHP